MLVSGRVLTFFFRQYGFCLTTRPHMFFAQQNDPTCIALRQAEGWRLMLKNSMFVSSKTCFVINDVELYFTNAGLLQLETVTR